jgi:hypothetical protein
MLFLWTESPAHPEAADDAWFVAQVYAAAVRREAEKAAEGSNAP